MRKKKRKNKQQFFLFGKRKWILREKKGQRNNKESNSF
jgi:hypothetical protein